MLEHAFADMIHKSADQLPENVVAHADWWGEHLASVVEAFKDCRDEDECILHFDSALSESLSDVLPSVRYADLKIPFDAFYMRFETSRFTVCGKPVDGAYVKNYFFEDGNTDPALKITFTTFSPDQGYRLIREPIQFLTADPFYSFFLVFDEGKTVPEALSVCLKEGTSDPDWDSDMGLDWFRQAQALMGLVINALSYAEENLEDVDFLYPSYTPDSLLAGVRNARSEEDRDRAMEKLEGEGFRSICFFGNGH